MEEEMPRKPLQKSLKASVTWSFKVDAMPVRETYWNSGKIKAKNKDELNASGVSSEHTSLDEALQEISQKMEKADKLHNQITQKNAKSV